MLRLRAAALRLNPWDAAGWPGLAAALLTCTTGALYAAATLLQYLSGNAGLRPDGVGGWLAEDYVAHLTGASLLVQGQAAQLYDRTAQFATQQALVSRPLTSLNAFVNPPAWALAAAILLPLGVAGAGVALKLVSILAGLTTLRGASQSRVGLGGALALLCSAPFLVGWLFGGMVAVLTLAFGGWLWLLRVGRPALAGAALSLLLLKPQYALVPVLYLLWKRQWPQVQGFALGAAGQIALTLLALVGLGGTPSLGDLLPFTTPDGGASGAGVDLHVSLRGLLLRMAPDLAGAPFYRLLAMLTVVLLAGFLLVAGREWHIQQRQRFTWEVLGLAAATNLLAFHNHVTGLVLLLPPAALLLSQNERHWRATVLALLLAAPSVPLLLWPLNYGPFVGANWALAIGALALWISHGRSWAASPRSEHQPGIMRAPTSIR